MGIIKMLWNLVEKQINYSCQSQNSCDTNEQKEVSVKPPYTQFGFQEPSNRNPRLVQKLYPLFLESIYPNGAAIPHAIIMRNP